jgi:hypothetical protein
VADYLRREREHVLEAAEVLDTLTPFRRESSDGPSGRAASDLPGPAPEANASDRPPPADEAPPASNEAREPKDDP